MNSVIVHFKKSSEDIVSLSKLVGIFNENCISETEERFYFWKYTDYESEYSDDEKAIVEKMLGCQPVSSFQLACRSAYGRFALKKLIELTTLEFSVVDEDLGGYWKPENLMVAYRTSGESSIYTIEQHQS